MELKKINLRNKEKEEVKFMFLSSNREVLNNKLLKDSIQRRGILSPLTVIRATDIDGKVELNDGTHIITKEELTENSFVVLDGQHRYKMLTQLLINEDKSNKKKESVEEINAELPCLIMTKEEVGNINEYMIELNSTSKNWKSTDYIENAVKVKEDDVLVKTINKFKILGFPISTISRFVCFDKSKLTAKTLADYINSDGEKKILNADAIKAIKLYEFLKFVGFDNSFMKKRYLIDYVIEKSKVTDINSVLFAISKMTKADEINYLRDKDCDLKVRIEQIINECVEKYVDEDAIDREKLKELKMIDYLNRIEDEKITSFLNIKIEEIRSIAA